MGEDETITARVPARLFGILARDANRAVILRRGPSKWVQLILWHTDTDTFDYGQWFKGRIYERRCDLSPDGSLFIYFAQKIEGRTIKDEEYTYAWTAISRPPYFTALALWPKGDCWNGGGLFLSNKKVWLNHPESSSEPHKDHQPKRLTVDAHIESRDEDESIYFKKLEREGWNQVEEGTWPPYSYMEKAHLTTDPPTWEKRHRSMEVSLLIRFLGYESGRPGGGRIFNYFLLDGASGEATHLTDASWADWDQRGRLVFTRRGQLIASVAEAFSPTLLADFNAQEPTDVIAPDWAKRW